MNFMRIDFCDDFALHSPSDAYDTVLENAQVRRFLAKKPYLSIIVDQYRSSPIITTSSCEVWHWPESV